MANRYWVGGTGTWITTSKWSTSSGGSGGASVPTVNDNVIFDANSATGNAYVVTVAANQQCADFSYTPVAINGATQFIFAGNFVIAGTFSTSGTQGNRRIWFRTSVQSLSQDISIATIGTVADADFRDVRITGAGGTLTGTRIGDLGGNRGITFTAPKSCYRLGSGFWTDDSWSATSGGTSDIDFFPLAQDTAIFDENTSTGNHTTSSIIGYAGTVDMSARTSVGVTLNFGAAFYVYGNWTLGSGISLLGAAGLNFEGRGTQVITSAGRTYTTSIFINCFGGTVELADALSLSTNSITVNHGNFDTKGYSVIALAVISTNSNVRGIKFGASTLTFPSSSTFLNFSNSTNLIFDAGTSSVVAGAPVATLIGGSGHTFYDVSFTSTIVGTSGISGANTFNNLSIAPPLSGGAVLFNITNPQIITGTLTADSPTANARVFLHNTLNGVPAVLTVGTLVAGNCDFSDIALEGAASGATPTNAGDASGNTGINFPAPKTAYWNLSGSQIWTANAWAATSGGTPDIANFPLPQDTAVFDNAGSATTVTIGGANISAVDMSARTSAMTLSSNNAFNLYGNWTYGTGVTHSGSATISFSSAGTSTITCNGVAFPGSITIDCSPGTVQLADALEMLSSRTLLISSGLFDAVSYNVTAGIVSSASNVFAGQTKGLRMGSGLWTLSGTGVVWSVNTATFSTGTVGFDKGTADFLLSDNSTTSKVFNAYSGAYNKLTLGGSATCTYTIVASTNPQFTELDSIKTVFHTVDFGSQGSISVGKWSITGDAAHRVTVNGTVAAGQIRITGPRVTGVNYLNMGTTNLVTVGLNASAGEFYAGPNSTGTGAGIVLANAPAPVTRYWRGGTDLWDASTNNWSATSGGAGGASVPTSADAVIFDSASSSGSYTVTVTAGPARCATLTVGGPASGDLTLGSTSTIPLFVHDDITFAATGLAALFNMSGGIVLTGGATGRTFTTNGVRITANTGNPTVDGVGCGWALVGAADFGTNAGITLKNGSFSTAGYSVILPNMVSSGTATQSLSLGASTVTMNGSSVAVNFGTTASDKAALTFDSGTSFIDLGVNNLAFSGNGLTFYDVALTGASNVLTTVFRGTNTFRNLSFVGRSSTGITNRVINEDQTVTGTLTISGGTSAIQRTFFRSNVIGSTRTFTCGAVAALNDIDFRDITIAGAAVSGGNLTGTRLGECKGNTGITFDAGTDKYWNYNLGNTGWSGTARWATSLGGTPDVDNFPLPQDTAIFGADSPASGALITVDAEWNLGSVDTSARTTDTMTLALTIIPSIYGNWTNGTGLAFTGAGTLQFAGRTAQTLTSAGVGFTQALRVESPNGTVTLQDAYESSFSGNTAIRVEQGNLDANGYNVTLPLGGLVSSNANPRTIAVGSGTWTLGGQGTNLWGCSIVTGLTVTGTGTISFTSAVAKQFSSATDYSGITIDQAGSGALTIVGFNSFANISNSYATTGATSILLNGNQTNRVGRFTASGSPGNRLVLRGTSTVSSPANLVHTGADDVSLNDVDLQFLRAYSA